MHSSTLHPSHKHFVTTVLQVKGGRSTSQLFDTEAMTRDFEVTARFSPPPAFAAHKKISITFNHCCLSHFAQGLVLCALELLRGGGSAAGKGGRWHHCLRSAAA